MNESLDVFLLMGQSNMSGRGRLDEVDPIENDQIRVFRSGTWSVAKEPLHDDKPDRVGVGLAMSFASELLAHRPGSDVGLVPCAVGGASLSQWMPGEALYQRAVDATRAACREGSLAGVLWHQGESDSVDPQLAGSYGTRFVRMMTSLRADLAAPRVPIVAGELGLYLEEQVTHRHSQRVNDALHGVKKTLAPYVCVRADGLMANPDGLHLDSQSLREFGRRYALEFIKLTSTGAGRVSRPGGHACPQVS
jgi:hypothetical protein